MSVVSKIPRPIQYFLVVFFFGWLFLSFISFSSDKQNILPEQSSENIIPTSLISISQSIPESTSISTLFTPILSPSAPPLPTKIQPPPTVQPSDDLNFTIRFGSLGIQVINNDSINFFDCKLDLNPGLIRSGYTYQINSIGIGETIIILFSEFVKGDGSRFNFETTKPQKLFVSCKDANNNYHSNYYNLE